MSPSPLATVPVSADPAPPVPRADLAGVGSGRRTRGAGGFARVVLARAFGLIVAVGLAILAAPAPAAQAHATLLFTSPTVDGAVPTSPEQILLVFDQAVVPARSTLTLTGPGRGQVPVGAATSGSNGQTVSVPVAGTLEEGEYLVGWQVTAADGDTMIGGFRFAVGSTAGLSLGSGGSVATRGAPAITGLRWALFLGLALALGGLVGTRLAKRTRRPGSSPPERGGEPAPWVRPGLWLSLAAAAGLAVLYLGDGSLRASLGTLSVAPFLASGPGRLAGLEVVALVVAVALAGVRRDAWAAGFVAAGVVVAEGFRAHPQAAAPGWGAALISVHLLAAAVWVGALIHVLRVSRWRNRRGESAGPLVRAYARLALALFLAVLATGTISGLLLIGLDDLVPTLRDTGYGRWLLVKLTFVIVVAGLALWARWHLARRPDRRQPAAAARVEVVLLAAVLAFSGVLTARAPPAASDLPLPFPPPAVGPVEGVGSRAGWIGVGAIASSGQLLVRLTTPDISSAVAPQDNEDYELVGNITDMATQEAVKLEFRRCGTGCFVAPVAWTRGDHTVTLEASSQHFEGGTTALPVAWPARQRPALLQRVVRAMRGVPRLVVHEQVTSDTNAGLGIEQPLKMSGRKYLGVGPYGSGVAPTVVVLSRSRTETTLALGYPGEGTYIRLTFDERDRIVREALAPPNHLISRTLVYPQPNDEHDLHRQ